jgi:predicted MFS family arabinose efflux permease
LRAARAALFAFFLLNGVGIASWAAHIPDVKQKFGFTDATLGLALLALALGSVGTLVFGGHLVARIGSRRMTTVAAFVFCLALPLLLLAPSPAFLFIVLPIFGACIGAMEVAMNVQAVAIEARYGRPIMSTFHALFSVGGLLGAALASLTLALTVAPGAHLAAVGFGLAALTAVSLPHLLPTDDAAPDDSPAFVLPTGPLLGLSLLAFFCLVAEGAMADWSAVYLRDTLGTNPAFAASGYAAFSIAMAAGRFGGDALRARFHAVTLVRASGILAAVGLGVALLVAQPVATLVGLACVGLGLANIVPVLFTAAGQTPGIAPGMGIAAVASVGYFGFLLGPPVIGFVARATSLTIGLGLVAVLIALIALCAGGVNHADRPATSSRAGGGALAPRGES